MALTYSSMLQLQTDLIEFDLLNSVSNKNFSSDSIDRDKPSLIMFICNHCPYVIHYHDEIIRLEEDYAESINMIAISSNDIISHPQDNPHKMKEMWNSLDLSFPYLFDETQEIAKTYDAVCTPDFFGYNKNLELQYRGRLRELKNLVPVRSGESDLFQAMKQIAETGKGPKEQIPSAGCGIKWKYD